ncbi:MAG: glycosyl hydrolase-related protein [Clostridiales bacterium]|jgi:alpha-mannosidase|nr:glycosyl hydrolase-related protein [Clostridiales bacterium]
MYFDLDNVRQTIGALRERVVLWSRPVGGIWAKDCEAGDYRAELAAIGAGGESAGRSGGDVPGGSAGAAGQGVGQGASGPAAYRPFESGGQWGGKDLYATFRLTATIPREIDGAYARLLVTTGREGQWDALNPQFIVWSRDGLRQGLDVNHREIFLSDCAKAGEEHSFLIEGWSGMVGGKCSFGVELQGLDSEAEALAYDLAAALDAASLPSQAATDREAMLAALVEAIGMIDMFDMSSPAFSESVGRARAFMREGFYARFAGNPATVNVVGHSHIDVAWQWRFCHSRRKAARSFSTAIDFMGRFPDYCYSSSQPQLLDFVKKDYPDLYEKVKARSAEGRFDPEGAMWVEADCNLIGGESMVRQLIHGKRFFRDEFGVDSRVLWLPDVFGYSAAMPQMLKKAGVDYFVTSKISWNEYNRMPHDVFMWRGIDGTEILSYLHTMPDPGQLERDRSSFFATYNGRIRPSSVSGAWESFKDKGVTRDVLASFGYGDGGGGPAREDLEYAERLKDGLPGVPKVRMTRILPFLEKLDGEARGSSRLAKWQGELYLELHRGTYTSIARNKRYNRRAELAMRALEFAAAARAMLTGSQAEYPAAEIDRMWETILINQFHDVIPGSSIGEVYEDSRAMYEDLLARAGRLTGEALAAVAEAGAAGAAGAAVAGAGAAGAAVAPYEADEAAGAAKAGAAGAASPAASPAAGSAKAPGASVADAVLAGARPAVPARAVAEAAAPAEAAWAAAPAGAGGGIAVFNFLQGERDDCVALPGLAGCAALTDGRESFPVQRAADGSGIAFVRGIPSMGFAVLRPCGGAGGGSAAGADGSAAVAGGGARIDGRRAENRFFAITFDEHWQIASIYDKRQNREVLSGTGNALTAYEDRPRDWDAWEISSYYRGKSRAISGAESCRVVENGPVRAGVEVARRFLNSEIRQTIYIYGDVPRIDFKTTVDWKESKVMLKTAFPISVNTDEATFEIQMGNIKRPAHSNTSWDFAKFEVCAHKWADLSERGYGAALLNDCKYGYRAKDGALELTLLKSATHPFPGADKEIHEFTYSLYPHEGDFAAGAVHMQAQRLNVPLRALALPGRGAGAAAAGAGNAACPAEAAGSGEAAGFGNAAGSGNATGAASAAGSGEAAGAACGRRLSLISLDAANVHIESVKAAYGGGGGIVVRLYEFENRRAPLSLSVCGGASKAYDCDLLENAERELPCSAEGGRSIVPLVIKPYEIRTIKIVPA